MEIISLTNDSISNKANEEEKHNRNKTQKLYLHKSSWLPGIEEAGRTECEANLLKGVPGEDLGVKPWDFTVGSSAASVVVNSEELFCQLYLGWKGDVDS